MKVIRTLQSAGLLACSMGAAMDVLAADATPFELGTINVTAPRAELGEIGEDQAASVVTREEMLRFNRDNVGDALNLLSGVTLTSGGGRNEKMVYLRGFDARQAPLFIDGIPVYVPYDGYLDLDRFSTADLAAIQVSKGFSSMSYGPNTLGGAVNLISRKPKERFEGEAIAGFGSGGAQQLQANLGSNQGVWYVQAGVSRFKQDNYPMSGNYAPTAAEDGGARDNSDREDSKISFKLGLTPNATDEYALSYYKQTGEKGNPHSTAGGPRYWRWPVWDKDSLYFVSKTALGDKETLKLRLFQDAFDNELNSYTDKTYSVLKTTGQGSVNTGRSIYDDDTRGGSIELSSTRFDNQELKFVTHYKVDKHDALDATGTIGETFKDTLTAYALEDNIQLSPALLISAGVSKQTLTPDTVYQAGSPWTLPNASSATNAQLGAFYDLSGSTRLYATLAKKSRLPTLKDRYSARFNTYIENIALQPENSLNYEAGYQGAPWPGAKAEAAVYYSDISDKIQSVFLVPGATVCDVVTKCQMQNVGEVQASGIELGLTAPLGHSFTLGGNYTLTALKNTSDPNTKITNVPRHKLIAHARYQTGERFDVVAFAETNGRRWVSNTLELPGYTLLNLKAVYHITQAISAEAGVDNLADRNYSLSDGYPLAGRTWFANAAVRF